MTGRAAEIRNVQFDRETTAHVTIRSCEPGRVRIAESWYAHPVIVTPQGVIEPWDVTDPAQLTLHDLRAALQHEPQVLLIGTGTSYVMCDVRLVGALAREGIGAEIMDTPAACRTFNVLVHEQRRVVAALFNA